VANFIPIQFETTELYGLLKKSPKQKKKKNKMSNDIRSVPELTRTQ